MRPYRLYLLNRDDHVARSFEGLFSDDEAALARAEFERQNHDAVEVWSDERLVGRLGREFELR